MVFLAAPHQQLRGNNAQSAQQGPARVDDLDLTVTGKSLRIRREAGSVPAIVSCTRVEITANSLWTERLFFTRVGDPCAIQ